MSRIARFSFTLVFAALACTTASADSVSVMFIGNSLTYTNDLPDILRKFAAESSSHLNVDVTTIAAGGAFLYDHWKRGQALIVLREKHPTYLVLQGQSTEPLSAPQNFSQSVRSFKAEADRVGTITILFSTWARPASDPYYKERSSGGSPAVMQARLDSAYANLARDTGAMLAPIGEAWELSERVAPEIQLLDGTQHPSRAGTYLAAAVLFRTVKASPVESTYFGGLPKETAVRLQQIADQTFNRAAP